MSQENVELVRSLLEGFLAGERDRYFASMAEDVAICPDASVFPDATPFTGREEFRRYLADIEEGWEGGSTGAVREIFPVGDRVVVRGDWGGRGLVSGLETHTSLTSIWTVRNREIVKIDYYFDHAEALEAVGLSE